MSKDRITERKHRRHVRLFTLLAAIVRPFFKKKFNFVCDDLSQIEGPYLLLCNHTTNYDPIFVGLAASKQLYFVASEHITRKRFLFGLLNFIFAPIIHHKGKAGVNTVAEMLRCLKAGYNVAIFPEGNRSFNGLTLPFLSTIGKLARKSGAKLITYKLEGGYLTQPRWSFSLRKGKLAGKLVHVYDADELKGMTDDEVNSAIERDLYEDAFKTQEKEHIPFKGKRLGYGLETTLFMCPKCRRIGQLKSSNTGISCECGYSAEYNEYGELTCPDGTKTTIAAWDAYQRESLEKEMMTANASHSDRVIFEDEIRLLHIGNEHSVTESKKTRLKAFCDHVEVGDRKLLPSDVSGVAVHSRNTIVTYDAATGAQYEIKGTNELFNALKYLYHYEITKSQASC